MVAEYLNRVLGGIAIVCIAAMMVSTVADVTGRYLFNNPILGTIELNRILLSVVAACTLTYCQSMKRHIRVEFLLYRLSSKPRQIVDGLELLLAMVVIGFIAYGCIDLAYTATMQGEYEMGVINFPTWPGRLALAAGCLVLSIQLAVHTIESFRLALRK